MTMTTVYFRPNLEYFDAFLDALKKSVSNSYVLTQLEDITEDWLKVSVDEFAKQHPSDLDWLDRHRYMLQEYLILEGFTRPFTASLKQVPAYKKGDD